MADLDQDDVDARMEHDPDLRAAALGVELEAALRSPLGNLIVKRAQKQAADAKEELANTDIHDTKRLAELQVAARTGDAIVQWIKEAIEAGLQAHDRMVAKESGEEPID